MKNENVPFEKQCKVKGLSITSTIASEKVNVETMKSLVQDFQKNICRSIEVPQERFTICSKTKTLHTEKMKKLLTNFSLDKRWMDFEQSVTVTFPYGLVSYEQMKLRHSDALFAKHHVPL